MGKTSRKKFTPEFKTQVAIEALKEQWSLAELAKKYEVSPTMISHWKAVLVKNAGAVFGKQGKSDEDVEKKNRRIISPSNKNLTIEEQCYTLGLPHSTYYYKPLEVESDSNLEIMRKIDHQFTERLKSLTLTKDANTPA